jgi:hypothetical protein
MIKRRDAEMHRAICLFYIKLKKLYCLSFVHLGESNCMCTKQIASLLTGITYKQKGNRKEVKQMNGYVPYNANAF